MEQKRGGARVGAGRKTTEATVRSRMAIKMFVEQNLPRLEGWLNQVAEGLVKVNTNGENITDPDGAVVFVVKPDPLSAIKVVADICEYHLPKLSRSEAVNVNIDGQDLKALSTDQLLQIRQDLLSQREPITIELESETPQWLK